jgi:hypothetical protein
LYNILGRKLQVEADIISKDESLNKRDRGACHILFKITFKIGDKRMNGDMTLSL